MREPYRKRRINLPPRFTNFKPSGVPRKFLETIELTVDEFEAIRLADYQQMEHQQAAEEMNISRPTFTRLIEKARQKLAQVIIEGKELLILGGNIDFVHTLQRCRDCGDEQIQPINGPPAECPECGSENIQDLAQKFLDQTNYINRKKEN
jgi:predicted DNA-binding protein (UPF0251 family)